MFYPWYNMKILLIITGHRQVDEFYYSSIILSKNCSWLSQHSDLFVHINNIGIDKKVIEFFNAFPQKNKKLFITSKNDGYRLGGIEAVADIIDMNICSEYDYVIHTHPDVFITRDNDIRQLLEDNLNNDICFLTTKQHSYPCEIDERLCYDFDFFIFKPKLLQTNIFKSIYFYDYPSAPEEFLYNIIIKNHVNHKQIKRFDNNCWIPRRIDLLGVWHEHELQKVEEYVRGL